MNIDIIFIKSASNYNFKIIKEKDGRRYFVTVFKNSVPIANELFLNDDYNNVALGSMLFDAPSLAFKYLTLAIIANSKSYFGDCVMSVRYRIDLTHTVTHSLNNGVALVDTKALYQSFPVLSDMVVYTE